MIEHANNPEIRKVPPEASLALQSYEMFAGTEGRDEALAAFLSGECAQLPIDRTYRMLSSSADKVLSAHRANLEELSAQNPSLTIGTPELRLAEVWLIKALRNAAEVQGDISQAQIDTIQRMNREIYGEIDPQITGAFLSKIWDKITAVQNPVLRHVVAELENGFVFTAENGEVVEVPALPRAEGSQELPVLEDDVFAWIQERMQADTAEARHIFETYAQQHDLTEFTPQDIAEVFRQAIAANESLQGVQVREDENDTVLSWSSEDAAVKVGCKRKNITSVDELVGVFVHEVYVHGGRYLGGQALGDAYLANGVFSVAEAGEQPGYLTFEEGLTTTLQKAVQGKKEAWGMAAMGNYIGIALAEQGFDSRQVFEVMRRMDLVFKASKVSEASYVEQWEAASRQALARVVRIFRGTPASKALRASDGSVLHFGKDKAYALGKVRAIEYLNTVLADATEEERDQVWQFLLSGKFDPTNRAQHAYALQSQGMLG
ncbi:MAG: hypothetical protein U0520_02255 [Candidatus Saccharimonadales bacterium]